MKKCCNCKHYKSILTDTCDKCNNFWLGTGVTYSEWEERYQEIDFETLWDDINDLVLKK